MNELLNEYIHDCKNKFINQSIQQNACVHIHYLIYVAPDRLLQIMHERYTPCSHNIQTLWHSNVCCIRQAVTNHAGMKDTPRVLTTYTRHTAFFCSWRWLSEIAHALFLALLRRSILDLLSRVSAQKLCKTFTSFSLS